MSVVTTLHLDRTEKLIHAQSVQDVEPILEHNKALRSLPQKSDWGRHVGSIPNVIITKWWNEGHKRGELSPKSTLFGPEMSALIGRKLRDPEYAFLRVDDSANPFRLGWRQA